MAGFTVAFIDQDHKICRRSDTREQFPFDPANPTFVKTFREDGASPEDVIAWSAPEKNNADVNFERDRRIIAGAVIAVSGHGDVPVTGTKDDKDVFLARRIRAREAEAAGVTDPVFVFRDRDNNIHNLTPLQMIDLCDKGIDWIEAMMVRSWEMKDGTGAYAFVDEENPGGIPDDLDQDIHWPKPRSD